MKSYIGLFLSATRHLIHVMFVLGWRFRSPRIERRYLRLDQIQYGDRGSRFEYIRLLTNWTFSCFEFSFSFVWIYVVIKHLVCHI